MNACISLFTLASKVVIKKRENEFRAVTNIETYSIAFFLFEGLHVYSFTSLVMDDFYGALKRSHYHI